MGKKSARLGLLKWCWIAVAAVTVVNAPHWTRSYRLTGSVLGMPLPDPTPRLNLTISPMTLRGTAANFVRNVSLHLGVPSRKINDRVEWVLRCAIRAMGVDPDDPNQMWLDSKFEAAQFSVREVHASNLLHLGLLAIAGVLALWSGLRRSGWSAFWFGAGILGGFLFFCAGLRWHSWMSRLHEPVFVLGAALIGYCLTTYWPSRFYVAAAGVLVCTSFIYATCNRTRSLVPWSLVDDIYRPRAELYFADGHDNVARDTIAGADYVNRLPCDLIAFESHLEDTVIAHSSSSMYVYPMMALIHADGGPRRIQYSGVRNSTLRYDNPARREAKPCAVVCLECLGVPEKWNEYSQQIGPGSSFGVNVIFARR